jgi:hypothetical protein
LGEGTSQMLLCVDKRTNITSDYCQSSCFTQGFTCDGDQTFCTNRTCVQYSNCFCSKQNYTEVIWYTNNQTLLSWQPSSSTDVVTQKRTNIELDLIDYNFYCLIEENTLNMILSPAFTGSYLARKDDWFSEAELTAASNANITLNSNIFLDNGKIYVDFRQNGIVKGSCSAQVLSRVTCQFSGCLFCTEALYEFPCLPAQLKVLFILCIVGTVTGILNFLPNLLFSLNLLMNILIFPFRMIAMCGKGIWQMDRARRMRNFAYENVVPRRSEEQENYSRPRKHSGSTDTVVSYEDGDIHYPAKVYGGRLVPDRVSTFNIFLLCLAFASVVPPVMGSCVNTVDIPSSGVVCTVNGNTQNCQLQFNTLVTLPFVSSGYCARISDATGTLGTLEVRLEYVMRNVDLAVAYYTSGFSGVSQFVRRCDSAGPCNSENCQSAATGGGRDDFGQLDNPSVIGFPGRSGCMATAGCWGNGCFLCSDACMYWGWALLPTGSTAKVYSPVRSSIQPVIGVYFNDQKIIDISVTSQTVTSGIWSAQIQGSLASDIVLFANNKIIVDAVNAYYGLASDANNPTKRLVGDIQAATALAFSNAGTNSFIYDPNIATVSASDVTFSASGYSNLAGFPKFPTFIGGTEWFYDKTTGQMRNNMTNPGAVIATITTTQPFNFTKLVTVVCPVVGTFNASGCSSCTNGAEIYIQLKSSCQKGIVSFSTTEPTVQITTPTKSIDTDFDFFSVRILTRAVSNDFYLTISGTQTNVSVRVVFTAGEKVELHDDEYTQNTQNGSGSGGINLLNPQSWLDWLIWAIIIVCILIFIGLSIPGAYYFIKLVYPKMKVCCKKTGEKMKAAKEKVIASKNKATTLGKKTVKNTKGKQV